MPQNRLQPRRLLDDTNRQRLIKARKRLGLTQVDVAERCGVTPMMINQCEVGKKQLSVDLLDRWAQSVGLELRVTLRRPAK